jgi:2-C-methyl-D-erythritol 2,4-cyclodiphosphate synthase
VEGRPLILGGVEIPSLLGLEGHSDADVLLHAICDALLGAAGLGDIGRHFPDSDPRFKGISSILLLQHVAGLLRKHRYAVGNIDATLLLESPRISPHVDAMCQNIARSLDIQPEQVSVKATTGEGLGFVGAGAGAAAHAVALIVHR